MQDLIQEIEIIPSVQSDHPTVKRSISNVQDESKGQYYWKFNNSLTHDKSFVVELKNAVPQFYKESVDLTDDISRWQFL